MTAPAEVGSRLDGFFRNRLNGADPQVNGLQRIGVGRSRDNWKFELTLQRDSAEQTEPLILRTDPPGGLVETDRQVEFTVLGLLEKSDLPTPAARWIDADGTWLGRPSLIMQQCPGDCDYRVLSDPGRTTAEKRELAEKFCELLVQVHAVDWQSLGLETVLHNDAGYGAAAELAAWVRILRQDQLEPLPELDFAIDYLTRSAPRPSRTTLVHADFKPGNILLEGQDITALLDWELAHLGDPLEDLGWVTQPLRRVEHLIDGSWEADDLISHYEHVSGHTIDRASLRWWQAFSTFKTAVMQVSGLRSFLEGRSDEPFRPTRRVLTTLLDHAMEDLS
ncbi:MULTISPECIES: phosphotransferase family protein [Citricoccus]|uniref:Phosphotransferase family protein n=1 Tax=Citricoccus parietis TaxID=592307 RepID=A0ABV6F0J3_9MICC|nr:phosphotransferase family protein [Citricoccus sp. K5]VXC22141.1 Aminoglycoside phosphotransferase [Citricoccus sp. K5]